MKYSSRMAGHAKFWHPKATAKQVQDAFRMRARIAQSVGEPRQRGDRSPYQRTYCLFDLVRPKKFDLEDLLDACLLQLETRRASISALLRTGGQLYIIIALLDDQTVQLNLDSTLMSRLLGLGASVTFEMRAPTA